jgi:hypothetical protein
MQQRKYDGGDIRRILIGMAIDPTVCARIAPKWTMEGLFESKWANLIGGWCVEHQRKFGSPPNGKLAHRFERWAQHTAPDEATVEAVERFLQVLSDQSQQATADDAQYLIDLAAKHFNQVRVKAAHKQAQVELDNGRYDEAHASMSGIRALDLSTATLLQPAEDFDAWDRAMQEERRRPLVTYPGDAGEFIGDAFCKGEFYAFEGPDKTGKTTLLVDFVYRACRAKRRVAFFDTGDGNEEEFLLRLGCRVQGAAEGYYKTLYPKGFEADGKLIAEEIKLTQVDPITAFRMFRKLCKAPDALRVECHPNSTLSAEGIDGILGDWARDGWAPDVVVIDYADILAPPEGIRDPLQQVDMTWKHLRRLSQARNCLVMTATQSSSAAYGNEKKLLGRKHFSGRKTKNAEVNGLIGINVSEDERKQQMARWNWIVRRKDKRKGAITVAGCFDVGNPVICSKW